MYMGFIFGFLLVISGLAFILTKMRHPDYNKTTNLIGLILIIIAIPIIVFSFIRIVPAGTVGVVDLFGRVSDIERHQD
ncbi:MAG: hypothetical protein NC912_04095 [Candidatus Omnitrophica bacterium]|nr:hypothetical protein [Candidatus Omnitrophota bacterium]